MLKHKKNKPGLVEASENICGKLMKKSGNKYQLQMQERFVKIDGKFLRYFKKKSEANDLSAMSKSDLEKQSIDLETSSWVRPYDLSPECKTFELQAGDGRVFTFEAKDPQEMKIWIESIELVRNQVKTQQIEAETARIISETPFRIRLFDSEGVEEFVQYISNEVNEIYPQQSHHKSGSSDTTNSNEFALKDHIRCASDVCDYLSEIVRETQKSSTVKTARYDVLAQAMIVINRQLTARLRPILQSQSSQLKAASLGDLHGLIIWFTAYQQQLCNIYCPVTNNDENSNGPLPTQFLLFDRLPYLCNLYVNGDDAVGGGGTVKNGATAHLVDHCIAVLNDLFSHPAEMLQRHKDGSFFTNAPTEMWSSLHQHLELAASTAQPILHVMIADKISQTLQQVIAIITNYIRNFPLSSSSSSSNPGSPVSNSTSSSTQYGNDVKEIELEFISALANDNALHIEEIIVVVNNFEMEEIRTRIDEIYDSVTIQLIECGNVCLQRLGNIVLNDIELQLQQVFSPVWIEGNQVKIAIATLSDYLSDFDCYLMAFWSGKFVLNMLELIVIRYCQSILFRTDNHKPFLCSRMELMRLEEEDGDGDGDDAGSDGNPAAETRSRSNTSSSTVSSIFSFGKKIVSQITNSNSINTNLNRSNSTATETTVESLTPTYTKVNYYGKGDNNNNSGSNSNDDDEFDYVIADSESLGRIAQDSNAIYAYFSNRCGSEKTLESLLLINEILLLLQLPIEKFTSHIFSRMSEFPSSAKSIYEIAFACMKLREEFTYDDIQDVLAQLQPAVEVAPAAAEQFAMDGIGEGSLGLLFIDVVPTNLKQTINSNGSSSNGNSNSKTVSSISSGLRMMAGIPLQALKSIIEEKEDDDEEDENNTKKQENDVEIRLRRDNALKSSSIGLVEDVMAVMSNKESELALILAEQERLEEEKMKHEQKLANGLINLEGHLEKKSPAHNLWQNRWFKLSTRTVPGDHPVGGDRGFLYTLMWFKKQGGSVIKSMEVNNLKNIILIESPRQLAYNYTKQMVMLSSEVSPGDDYKVVQTKVKDSFGPLDKVIAHYSFAITSSDGKEQFLRAGKVDKVIRWINALSTAAELTYNGDTNEWTNAN